MKLTPSQVDALVLDYCAKIKCGEIFIDEEGPIEPTCAASIGVVVTVIKHLNNPELPWPGQQG